MFTVASIPRTCASGIYCISYVQHFSIYVIAPFNDVVREGLKQVIDMDTQPIPIKVSTINAETKYIKAGLTPD